ncbi:MAG: hypothetical protein RL417_85 [Pseudomonadota bacterium]|jgi:hypothetical protein
MIFQPERHQSEPNSSDRESYRGYDAAESVYQDPVSRLGDSHLPVHSRISNRFNGAQSRDIFPDDISDQRTLRMAIAGVQHRGDAVITDIAHEFPNLKFSPTTEHILFREALIEAVRPTGAPLDAPHPLIRQERLHRGLGVALSNLVAHAANAPLRELSFDAESAPVPAESESSEYLASAWAIRSFIRVAAPEPELFRILVTEMATLHATAGRLTLGVPMSPLLVYELFNAAARNPELTPDVVRAFQIIGYKGNVGEKLFAEFAAMLEKQLKGASAAS